MRLDQFAEATEMLEAYKQIFIQDVTAAWDSYVQRTVETVQMEAELHRQVVEDTINYLWNRSAFPGQSLDDVYPRPQVAFAAKNTKAVTKHTFNFSRRDAGIIAIAVLGFASLLCIFNQKEKSTKVHTHEEQVDDKKPRKSKVNIFKKKTGEPLL